VQSPSSEANWFAASQEIPRISQNPKFHYRTHKRPLPVHPGPAQSSQYNHIPPPRDQFKYYLPIPRLGLPSGLFPSGFPTKNLYTPFSSHIRATCSAHLFLLDFITRTILGEEYKSFSSSLCSLLHSPHYLLLPRSKYSPQHHTHAHTHTHIYIYIYIYILKDCFVNSFGCPYNLDKYITFLPAVSSLST